MAAKLRETEIQIIDIKKEVVKVPILGISGLYFHAFSEKAKRELLHPKGRLLTSADRAGNLKHDPVKEFESSVYEFDDDTKPTRLCFPTVGFKGGVTTSALDLPGVRKSEIGRLLWVEGEMAPIWGLPFLRMEMVRNSDMNRTPDVRTRAFLPQWASEITVSFIGPKIAADGVFKLITAAGLTCGLGDGRQEKGTYNYGRYEPTSVDDPRWLKIVSEQGLEAQDKALDEAKSYDRATEELLGWYKMATKVA